MYQLAVELARSGFDRDAVWMDDRGIYSASYGMYSLNTAYQPIIGIDSARSPVIYGYEALVRCQNDTGSKAPFEFFADVPEQDRLYVESLCHELHIKNWQSQAEIDAPLFLNIDGHLLTDKKIDAKLIAVAVSKAQLWGIDPEQLICEVIESPVGSNQQLNYVVDCLRDLGVRIAVDDFGVDHSNIDRVKSLKPDYVKLDGVFFHRFAANGMILPMLKGLVQRLHDQGAKVIAEAVETEHQRDTALDCDIDYMQGYFFGRPEILT